MSYICEYPRLDPDWDFWIIQMNMETALGKKPSYFSSTTETVMVVFDIPLTGVEKAKLDQIMADKNVGLYPKSTAGYTVLKIKDVWDYRSIIEQAIGKKVTHLHFPPPLPDGTHVMELWIEGVLTTAERRRVKDAYTGLISE